MSVVHYLVFIAFVIFRLEEYEVTYTPQDFLQARRSFDRLAALTMYTNIDVAFHNVMSLAEPCRLLEISEYY
jgi:hypothetical protein